VRKWIFSQYTAKCKYTIKIIQIIEKLDEVFSYILNMNSLYHFKYNWNFWFMQFHQKTFTTRNSVICNHYLCNWDATACRMQLSLVFYATTMDFCPLFGCVCNYDAPMITFIPTFGWFLWYIIVYFWYIIVCIWYAYTHSCMCNQNMPTMVFW